MIALLLSVAALAGNPAILTARHDVYQTVYVGDGEWRGAAIAMRRAASGDLNALPAPVRQDFTDGTFRQVGLTLTSNGTTYSLQVSPPLRWMLMEFGGVATGMVRFQVRTARADGEWLRDQARLDWSYLFRAPIAASFYQFFFRATTAGTTANVWWGN